MNFPITILGCKHIILIFWLKKLINAQKAINLTFLFGILLDFCCFENSGKSLIISPGICSISVSTRKIGGKLVAYYLTKRIFEYSLWFYLERACYPTFQLWTRTDEKNCFFKKHQTYIS